MKISVKKLTNIDMLRKANEFTSGHESKMGLATAYRLGHSPIRTQIFWVKCREIPLFVASQLVRQHVGVQHFQRSRRTDRGGADFREVCEDIATEAGTIFPTEGYSFDEEYQHRTSTARAIRSLPDHFDRYAPTDLAFICNAEALMNMAHKRLCGKASPETREVVQAICELVEEQDPDLYQHLVPQCVYRGGICPESKCCGYIHSEAGKSRLRFYKALFRAQ